MADQYPGNKSGPMMDMSWLYTGPDALSNDPGGNVVTRGAGKGDRKVIYVGRAAVGSKREEGGFEQAILESARNVLRTSDTARRRAPVVGIDPLDPRAQSAYAKGLQELEQRRNDAQEILNAVQSRGGNSLTE